MYLIDHITIDKYSNNTILRQLRYVLLYLKYVIGLQNVDDLLLLQVEELEFNSSKSHLNCTKNLDLLGAEFDIERNINGLFVDICIDDRKIVIEVTELKDYVYKSDKVSGHIRLKNMLLNTMGWTVINVPYWEWDELRTTRDKQEYLRKLIF